MGYSGGSNYEESACNAGDLGLIPGSGRSSGERMATHSSILAWGIPWTKKPDGLPWGCKELERTEQLTLRHILGFLVLDIFNYRSLFTLKA